MIPPKFRWTTFDVTSRLPRDSQQDIATAEVRVARRIVAVMNFYTESCPESTRPSELNRHLFGQAVKALLAAGRRPAASRWTWR